MTRTFSEFWTEWREQNGLPAPTKRPDIEPFATEHIPMAPARRRLRINEKITCDQPAVCFDDAGVKARALLFPKAGVRTRASMSARGANAVVSPEAYLGGAA